MTIQACFISQHARSQKPTPSTWSVNGRHSFKVRSHLPLTGPRNELTNVGHAGTPGPDFPSGVGESHHLGRLTPDFVMQNIDVEARRAMGLTRYDAGQQGLPERERQMLQRANEILGFDA